MSPENIILGGLGFFCLACLVYAFGPRAKAAVQQVAAPKGHPIRAAFDQIEHEARELAAKQLADAIGAHYAAEYKAKVVSSIAPKDSAPSPSGGGA